MTGIDERPDIVFAKIAGRQMRGDLYLPSARQDKAPVVLCIHGGGWIGGTRKAFGHWGRFLAGQGLAAFAVDYRLAESGAPAFPGVMADIVAAAEFLYRKAGDLGVDCARMAMFGQSAGGHLAALSALGGYDPAPPFEAVSGVKALVTCYGIFDLAAHWRHELAARPGRATTELLLGRSLTDDPRLYFEASPLSYVTSRAAGLPVLISFGTGDDVVPHERQSLPFATALGQCGNEVRTVVVPAAGHYWANEPFEMEASRSAFLAPRLVAFLKGRI